MSMLRPKILAIDDTPANLMVLAKGLSEDFQVHIATSGAEGLAMAKANLPDIILLDVMMPGMDGYEVCRRLKADEGLREVPIVFVTADADSTNEVAGLSLGAADYLHKPVNVNIARQRVHNLIQQATLRREVEQHRNHLEELVAERTRQLEQSNAELQQANIELKAAKVAGECASRAKSTFIGNISHELYTPLNAILGMNELIRRHLKDTDLQDKSERLADAAKQMHDIIKRILQLAELESNEQAKHAAEAKFNVREIIDISIAHFHHRATQKGLSIERDIDSNVPKTVYGLSAALRQVLENFLSNAIKFSHDGRIVVRARVETAEDKCVQLRFEVEDRGCGIAEEALPTLFDHFHMTDESLTRRQGGIGIGLAINRHLAKLLNGEIGVNSTPGQGSRFWIIVPLYHFSFEWLAPKASVSEAYTHLVAEAYAKTGQPPQENGVTWQLEHLINLLALDDIEALKIWEQSNGLIAPMLGKQLPAFTEALQSFAFDEAREILLQLKDNDDGLPPDSAVDAKKA